MRTFFHKKYIPRITVLYILISIFFGAVLLLVVFVLNARMASPFIPTGNSPLPSTVATPSGKPDPTNTWAFYKNPSGYLVKYPKEMTLNVGGKVPYDMQLTDQDLSVTFFTKTLQSSSSIKDYGTPQCVLGSSGKNVTQTIGGNVFYRTPRINDAGENPPCQEAVTALGVNTILDIQATINNADGNALFNHILSTFTRTIQTK